MKKRLLASVLGAVAIAGTLGATPYKCDFSKAIDTSNHAFKAASNWSHIVGSIYDSYNAEDMFMSYYYRTSGGVDNTEYLEAGNQYLTGNYSSSGTVKDYLITPKVKGDVTVWTRMTQSYTQNAYIEVYSVNEDGTIGTLIKKLTSTELGTAPAWRQATLATGLTDYQRLALRCCYVSIDDFEAGDAMTAPEPGMSFVNVTPSETTGVLKWNQQSNGKVKVTFMATVTNDGETDLTPGMENYSISVFNNDTKADLFTIPVPEALAIGATSEPFEISGELDTSNWSWSGAMIPLYLRENLTGNVVKRANSQYNEYGPKLVFRDRGTTSTSSRTTALQLGIVSEDVITDFEIYNSGNAPLQVKGISVPDGFSVVPSGEFTIEAGAIGNVTVTLHGDQPGSHSGNLVLTYLKPFGDGESTYTLPMSATVVTAGAFTWDFGTERDSYPEGSIALSGISTDYVGSNYYLKGGGYNNRFILPLLHAEAGESFSFETARDSYSSSTIYGLKAYLSTDRKEWGDPVLELGMGDVTDTKFESRSFSAPAAGDYYVMIELQNGRLDNVAGFTKVSRDYDIYITDITVPATKQTGETIKFDIKTIAPLAAEASDYTAALVSGEDVIVAVASKTLEANAKTEVSFPVEWKPEVESTTVYDLRARFTFTDGTVIESAEPKQCTITCQPDFVFFNKDESYNLYNKPSNRTQAISFGKTNETGASQEFDIFNWGTKDLTVTSVTVPEGFSVNVSECTVAPKERQRIEIALSASDPGSYSGKLTIKYLDGAEEEQTFELPVSATLLDSSKWYASFKGDDSSEIVWPAGTIHDSSLSGANIGVYSEALWAINGSTAGMMISPLLHAEAGDIIEITAKLYSSGNYYADGYVKVYAADTREALSEESTRTLIAKISGKDVAEDMLVTDVWSTISVAIPEAGDNYFGFELGNRLYVSSFYGLHPVSTDAELLLAGSNIAAEAMQNVAKTMTMSVRNFGMNPASGGSCTIAAYVDGERISEEEVADEIPVNYTMTEDATLIPIGVRYPGVGTFPVRLELTYGDRTISTEETDVTFSPETFSSEKQIGENSTIRGNIPMDLYSYNSEAVMLYNADDLGLNDGDRISDLVFKGYSTKEIKFKYDIRCEWTDDQQQTKPTDGLYDIDAKEQMIPVIIDEEDRIWADAQGSTDNHVELIRLHFEEPLVYHAGKSLRILLSHYAPLLQWTSGCYFEVTDQTRNAYYHSNDNYSTFSTNSWNAAPLPVLYATLAVNPAIVTGIVTDNGTAVAGAKVTFVSNDGDNVQYSATTGADGRYNVTVIQNSRYYDVTAQTEGKEDFLLDQTYPENSTLDFELLDVVEIDNRAGGHSANDSAIVKLYLDLEPGLNTLVLPFDLNADETKLLFGDDCELLRYANSTLDEAGNLRMNFVPTESISGGTPYVINSYEAPVSIRLRGKAVTTDITPVADADNYAEFHGTYEGRTLEEGMYLLNSGNFVAASRARVASTVAPYSGYVKTLNASVKNVSFSIEGGYPAAIEEIEAGSLTEHDEIFNLQGMRVRRPAAGIYIVNGKKMILK